VADAYVIDTGVFLRWFIDQDGFEQARDLQQKLVDGAAVVETVDFARVEVAGVLRKKGLLAGRLTVQEFTAPGWRHGRTWACMTPCLFSLLRNWTYRC
jgi:hypothetical protein